MRDRITAVMTGLMLLLLSGCAAETYTIVTDQTGATVIQGTFTRSVLEEGETFPWFRTNYTEYRMDSVTVEQMRPLAKELRVLIVAGTWCGDSKREVPKQLKILDALGVPEDRITMVGVDRTKRSTDSTTQLNRIQMVPTTIFFRGTQEIGRIVEYPHESQEKDLLKLLSY